MFNVYDPLEEYREGQEYEISNGIRESLMTDLELEEIIGAQLPWLAEQGSTMLTSIEIEKMLSESQPTVRIPSLDDAGKN